jgi:hypothetical protein
MSWFQTLVSNVANLRRLPPGAVRQGEAADLRPARRGGALQVELCWTHSSKGDWFQTLTLEPSNPGFKTCRFKINLRRFESNLRRFKFITCTAYGWEGVKQHAAQGGRGGGGGGGDMFSQFFGGGFGGFGGGPVQAVESS